MKQKIQLIEKQVKNANDVVRISEELDREYQKLTGIAFLDNVGNESIIQNSSIEGKELFPKNFEVAFLQSNDSVPPNERFFTLEGIEAKGNKLEIDFKDDASASGYPYTLKIYVRLENN